MLMKSSERAGWTGIVSVSVIAVVEWLSILVASQLADDAKLFIATFGGGMFVFGLAALLLLTRHRTAWCALWYLPAFFLLQPLVLGNYGPAILFGGVSAASLYALRDRASASRTQGQNHQE
jgi:hypothetical protein